METGPYKEAEYTKMIEKIKDYAERGLDQWDLFQIQSEYGPVYVSISRGPEPNLPEHYRQLVD
jgi:hypothetical protein